MKRLTVLLVSFALLLSACATDMETRRRQASAFRDLGKIYIAQGKYTLALKELLKAEERNPDDYLLQNFLGLAYVGKDRYDEAIFHFRKAIELKPDFADAKNNLGSALLKKGEVDAAISVFKDVLANDIYLTPHLPLTNLGIAYLRKKDYTPVERHFLNALKLEPEYPYALKWFGATYLETGRAAEAVGVLETLVRAYPEMMEGHRDLARAYRGAGNPARARQSYQQAIQLAPDRQAEEELRREAGLPRP